MTIYTGKYKNVLKSKKWQDIRKFVFNRDGNKCLKCSSTDNLNAHHLYYYKGQNPLNTPVEHIVTLCNRCHKIEHEEHDFKSNIVQGKNPKPNKRYKKKKPKWKLSKREKALQARYKKHRQ